MVLLQSDSIGGAHFRVNRCFVVIGCARRGATTMRFLITATLFFGLVAQAASGQAIWSLDSFSFAHFPGAGATVPLPEGRIPIEIKQLKNDVWLLRIRAKSLPAASALDLGNLEVRATLANDAGGRCTLSDEGFHCSLHAVFSVSSSRDAEPVRIPVTFTSRVGGKSAGLVSTGRAGAPLDAESGYLQLVGLGEGPLGSAIGSGEPFYVVLSGRVVGLPSKMRSQQNERAAN
jgi:hypothetical protein